MTPVPQTLRRRFPKCSRPANQGGVVAVLVAVMVVVLLGSIGLAIDAGRLYLTKTELQNSADACSLAASYELTNAPYTAAAVYRRAGAAGESVASRNRVNFQGSALAAHSVSVSFATDLRSHASWVSATTAGSSTPRPQFVRCTLSSPGMAMFFMGMLGVGAQTVSSMATATLRPSQSACAVPVGLCAAGSTIAPFGLIATHWYSDWRWIGFAASTSTARTESDLDSLLAGTGMCSVTLPQSVGQVKATGAATAQAWNTRFGLYQASQGSQGSQNADGARAAPDFSGYAYTAVNWPERVNALTDFMRRRSSFTPFGSSVANGNSITGLALPNTYALALAPTDYQTRGADRRLVVTPIIDCSALRNSTATTPILGWGCVLMLQPINSPTDAVNLEYEGLANRPGSPCVSSGIAGAMASIGPMVPALVQ